MGTFVYRAHTRGAHYMQRTNETNKQGKIVYLREGRIELVTKQLTFALSKNGEKFFICFPFIPLFFSIPFFSFLFVFSYVFPLPILHFVFCISRGMLSVSFCLSNSQWLADKWCNFRGILCTSKVYYALPRLLAANAVSVLSLSHCLATQNPYAHTYGICIPLSASQIYLHHFSPAGIIIFNFIFSLFNLMKMTV